MQENYFQRLYNIDVNEKKKQKNGLYYLSWAAAWAEVKKVHPDATYKIYEMVIDDHGNTRPWFDDGKTGWVKTGVTINDLELIEDLPIMNFKNQSIPAENITSTDANKSIQRSLTKACARHGLGLYIYEGEDLVEEEKKKEKVRKEKSAQLKKIQDECVALINELYKTDDADRKTNVLQTCKKYSPNGNPRVIEDIEKLNELKKELEEFKK